MLKSWNYNFFGKKANFPVNKRFWPSFSPLIEHNKDQETLFEGGPQGLFDLFSAINKNLSLGPKMSRARFFSKISCSHGDRSYWLNFHRLITCDKTLGTVCKCPQRLLTFTVEVMRSFLQDLRGCWQNNFSKKKAKFHVRKKLWPPFSRIIEYDKPQRTFCKGLQGFFTITVFVIISIL